MHGHDVVQRLATSPTTSPEADGHGEFSPQRVQQVKWTSPMTNKLLLEAGFGTTLLPVGGQGARSQPDPRSGARREHRADLRAGNGDTPAVTAT